MAKRIAVTKKVYYFSELYAQFQTYNRAKNLSPSTIKSYHHFGNDVMHFKSKDFNILEITEQFVYAYIEYLRDVRKNNEISVNSNLKHFRAFVNWCSNCGYLEPVKIRLLKTTKAVKETFTDEELEILLRKPDVKKCTFAEYRNWVIVNYLIGTGNRMSTVLNIQIRDVDFRDSQIILRHTKNRKQQILPITPRLKQVLQEYMKYRQAKSDDEYLFCSDIGENLEKQGIRYAINRYCARRGVMKTGLHIFRHTFAKKWILAGGDIVRLQKLLGHSSLAMVTEYLQMFTDDIRRGMEMFNPLEQIRQTGSHIKMPK